MVHLGSAVLFGHEVSAVVPHRGDSGSPLSGLLLEGLKQSSSLREVVRQEGFKMARSLKLSSFSSSRIL